MKIDDQDGFYLNSNYLLLNNSYRQQKFKLISKIVIEQFLLNVQRILMARLLF